MGASPNRAAVLAAIAAALIGSQACSSRPAARSSPSPSQPPSGSSAAPLPGAASPTRERALGSEGPVAAESNPPGDIPDSVQFIGYTSPVGGYSLKVPEGWARTESGMSVTFADKLTSIHVEVQPATQPPTPESVRSTQEPALAAGVRAFKEVEVQPTSLPAGPAVLLRYQANSDPDAVTGRQVRLEIDRYEVFRNGRLAIVSMSAPAGSDNVDVWRLVSRSLRWTS